AVPVVALHAVALAGDQRQAEVVVAAALGAEEAVAVGVDRQAFAGADVGALGIADARIGLAAGGLGLAGQGDRRFRVQRPGMPAVELAHLGGHAIGIGQAGGRVGLGVPGDGAG